MARVNPELKKTLEADGRWREFMLLRREKIAGGMKSADALNAAIAEVCPELARYGSLCKTGRKRVGSGAEAEGKVAEAADVVDALEERKRVKENGRLVMPVSVRMNHAVADGYLVANVFRLLEKEINCFVGL